jgi:hypothetical protein
MDINKDNIFVFQSLAMLTLQLMIKDKLSQ